MVLITVIITAITTGIIMTSTTAITAIITVSTTGKGTTSTSFPAP